MTESEKAEAGTGTEGEFQPLSIEMDDQELQCCRKQNPRNEQYPVILFHPCGSAVWIC